MCIIGTMIPVWAVIIAGIAMLYIANWIASWMERKLGLKNAALLGLILVIVFGAGFWLLLRHPAQYHSPGC